MHCMDAHLHMTEQGVSGMYPDLDDLEIVFSCTSRPEEWAIQEKIQHRGLKRFYGLHPWYADLWDEDVGKTLVSFLEKDAEAGVGEIGMDSKKGDPVIQSDIFGKQLELASEYGRTVTVHMVGMEKQVLEHLRPYRKDIPATILHSFKAESYIKPFSELGCYFSLSPRLLDRADEKLKPFIGRIPEDRILVETDAPFTGRNFEDMHSLMERFAGLRGMQVEEFTETVYRNLERIF